MKNVVLGVSGSVAAFRACDLAREFVRAGHTVRTCLTDGAQKFVTPALFEALTGQPCLIDVFDEPDRGRMAHIDWARAADVIVVAPATANVLNKLANGHADDMLTTIALAFEGPTVVAPAMNPSMWDHETTQRSVALLRSRATAFVEPGEGEVACGEHGQGRLAPTAKIVTAVFSVLEQSQRLKGKRVLVSSGPTEEPIDDVRSITNRSSGKMGAAIAQAALLMGGDVTIVAGPQSAPLPRAAKVVRIKTALQMRDAVMAEATNADMFVSVAAVADFRPADPVSGKLRSGSVSSIQLVPNPDIVAEVAALGTCRTIAFAAEPSKDLKSPQDKLRKKGVFAIAVNDVSDQSIGFASDENELALIFADGRMIESGRQSKINCALWLLRQVAEQA